MSTNIVRANPLTKLPPYAQDTDRPYVGDPWSRQERESSTAFKAFSMWLTLEDRTNANMQARYLAETGKKINVYQWRTRHRWNERTEAYDNYLAAAAIAANKRQIIKSSVKHARENAEIQEVLMLPMTKLRERIKAQGDSFSFIDAMEDADLMKLARSFAQDIPGFQKAERDALTSTTNTVVAPAQIRAKGEAVRAMLANPAMSALFEKLTFEMTADVVDEPTD